MQRELITIGLGNYSNLVCVEYINGNTVYDTEQPVLYMEKNLYPGDYFRGSNSYNDGMNGASPAGRRDSHRGLQGGSSNLKVPRLVLLDHHHPSRIVNEFTNENINSKNSNHHFDDHSMPSHEYGESEYSYGTRLYKYEQQKLRSEAAKDDMNSHKGHGRRHSDEDDSHNNKNLYEREKGAGYDIDDVEDSDDEDSWAAFYGGVCITKRIIQRQNDEMNGRKMQGIQQNFSKTSIRDSTDQEEEIDRDIEKKNDHFAEECDHLQPIFRLRDELESWYKYSAVSLHKSSYSLLPSSSTYSHTSGIQPFHCFTHGLNNGSNLGDGTILSSCFSNNDNFCHNTQIQQTFDNIRYQLENADACQGFQLFCDADGAMGGLAVTSLRYLYEEYGCKKSSIPTVTHALFTPLFVDSQDDFAGQRLKDEVVLNRCLATFYLGNESSLYIPYNLRDWGKLWDCDYMLNDMATASFIAGAADSVFYSCRDTENWSNRSSSSARTGGTQTGGGYYYLSDYVATIKPVPRLKMCSMFASLPMSVKQRALPESSRVLTLASMLIGGGPAAANKVRPPTFLEFLHDHTIMKVTCDLKDEIADLVNMRTNSFPHFCNNDKKNGMSSPLDIKTTTYVPLTHSVRHSPTASTAGSVHGQVLSLRGVASLEDYYHHQLGATSSVGSSSNGSGGAESAASMDRSEALARYFYENTICSNSFSVVTEVGYPISGTFSPEIFGALIDERVKHPSSSASLHHGNNNGILPSQVPLGAHLCTTDNAAGWLDQLQSSASEIIKGKRRSAALEGGDYAWEKDEWKEVMEGIDNMHDDYDHEGISRRSDE